jgi:peroxiredoxin
MAESANTPVSELATTPVETDSKLSGARKKQIAAGLLVAGAILLLAWYVAGREGLSSVGQGGINTSLLPKVGEEAPDFVAISPEGQIVHLSDFRGQPVWLNFWGSWCPPCRAEMPDIQTAYEELQPQGLTLLAVSLGDKPSEAMNFAELNGVTFDILLDPDRSLTSQAYPIYNFPTHIFIDKDGIVRNIVLSEMSTEQAVAAAQSILPQTAAVKSDDQ